MNANAPDWKIKRGESEFAARDAPMLQQWARAGQLLESDLVFHPLLQRWMYAKELGELSGYFPQKPQVVITKPATSPLAMGCAVAIGVLAALGILMFLLSMIFGR